METLGAFRVQEVLRQGPKGTTFPGLPWIAAHWVVGGGLGVGSEGWPCNCLTHFHKYTHLRGAFWQLYRRSICDRTASLVLEFYLFEYGHWFCVFCVLSVWAYWCFKYCVITGKLLKWAKTKFFCVPNLIVIALQTAVKKNV